MVAAAIREQGTRIALDVGAEAKRFANPLLPDTRSEVALPLRVGKQVIGALDVQSSQLAAFDETSAAMLQNVADQIAIALNNAAQYQRELTRAQQTTRLLEAAVKLTAHGQTTVLHNRIVELMAALLHVDTAGLWQLLETDELTLTHAIGQAASSDQTTRPIGRRHRRTGARHRPDLAPRRGALVARCGNRSGRLAGARRAGRANDLAGTGDRRFNGRAF